jgi:hypothetical protein
VTKLFSSFLKIWNYPVYNLDHHHQLTQNPENSLLASMRDVKNAMDQNGKDWWVEHHHGFGMGVRNLLREGGFNWGPVELDDLWVGLVERAVRKKFPSHNSQKHK